MTDVVVHETAGLDRAQIPVRFGLELDDTNGSEGWQVYEGDDPVPSQITVTTKGPHTHLAVYAVLPRIRGNEQRTLRIVQSPAHASPAPPRPLHVSVTNDGWTQLTAGTPCFASPSACPVIGFSTPDIQGSASAPQHLRGETMAPTTCRAHHTVRGDLLDEWILSGDFADSFHYETRLTVHHAIARVDVHTRLRNGGAPAYLSHFGHRLHLALPESISVLARELSFGHLVDVNLASETIRSRWSQAGVRLTGLGDDLTITSTDFATYDDGMITATTVGRSQDALDLTVHRIEPIWHYRGITSHAPTNHLHFHVGQTRSAAFSVTVGPPETTEASLLANEPGITVMPVGDHPQTASSSARDHVLERALRFVVPSGEYQGLIAGGRCHINHRLIEYGVNRADYAEYLLRHALRTGSSRLIDTVRAYADRFVDVAIHRADHAPDVWGAVRQRYRENLPDRVRSMRGPCLLLALYDLTAEENYWRTAFEIGDYVVSSFPHRFARQGGACRELAQLYARTGDAKYRDKAYEILDAVRDSQLASGPWFEYFEQDNTASTLDVHQAGRYTIEATEKPEMSSYNIIGVLDAAPQMDITPWLDTMERAADWMVETQDDEGAWRFPRYDSEPQWGHGIYQDVLAMLLAYRTYGKQAYLTAADRGIDWAQEILSSNGYIPSVTRQEPHQYLEASLTYFYGLEALSLREEL